MDVDALWRAPGTVAPRIRALIVVACVVTAYLANEAASLLTNYVGQTANPAWFELLPVGVSATLLVAFVMDFSL